MPTPTRPATSATAQRAPRTRACVSVKRIPSSSGQVEDAGLGAELFLQPARLGTADQLGDEARRIVRVAEVRRVPDAARDARGELAGLQAVQAEAALARVADRRASVSAAQALVVLRRNPFLVRLAPARRAVAVPLAEVGRA